MHHSCIRSVASARWSIASLRPTQAAAVLLAAQILAFLPGGKLTLPFLLMQTSIFAVLGTVTEPVVSAVTGALAITSVSVTGQFVPELVVGDPIVVVRLFAQVMTPPVSSVATGSAMELPPELPLHPVRVTVEEMLPVIPVHLIFKVFAGCDADAGPVKLRVRAEIGITMTTPASSNLRILSPFLGCEVSASSHSELAI